MDTALFTCVKVGNYSRGYHFLFGKISITPDAINLKVQGENV